MSDQLTPASPALSDLRAKLEQLFERHDVDPRGTRDAVRRLIATIPTDRSTANRQCLGAARALDALITVRMGQIEEALGMAESALRLLQGSGDYINEVRATNSRAEALMHLGRLEEARAFLEERIARSEAREEPHGEHISLYSNLAAVFFYSGSPAGALQPLARALELATSLHDDRRRALVLGNFGNLYGQLGDHSNSLQSHLRCAEILRRRGDKRDLANSLHNMGVQLDRLGKYEEALATFEESLSLRDSADDPNKIAKTELDRAYTLVHIEHFDDAELAIERALELHRRIGSQRQESRALTSLGNLEYERGRYARAIECFTRSKHILESLQDSAAAAATSNDIGLIEAHISLGYIDKALAHLESFSDLANGAEAGPNHARLCDLWMRALEVEGQPERALEFAKRRIEILEQLHASDAERAIENLQSIHQVELMRQRERDQVRVRAELEALVVERTQQLMESNTELEARVDELVRAEYMRSRLEEELRQAQKMDAIGRLAGGVAHDFNNLLTVILGRGELLLEEVRAGHAGHDSLREMMEAASRAARLTVQLLAFGRKQALRPTRLDVESILDDLQRLLSRLLGEQITITSSHDRGQAGEARPLRVLADRGQLEQVMINLAINARDAMPRGGRLRFDAKRVELAPGSHDSPNALPAGSYVSVKVTDTGEGMSSEVREQVFEPFFTTKGLGKGTGLGLSTVHGIVHQSGGTITVESTPGVGSTFEVLLPATDDAPLVAVATTQPTLPSPPRRTVLVVEDDAGLRRVIREGLSRRGFAIVEADDGEAALGLAHDVDLVICDRVLPRLSGLEVLAALRTTRPDLPFLLISGHPTDEQDEETIAGIRFLSKPFKLEALVRTLQDMLA